MRHHVATHGEVVILHQCVEAFCPTFPHSVLKWLKSLGHILAWGVHKSQILSVIVLHLA